LFLRDLTLAKPLGKDWPIEKMIKKKNSNKKKLKNMYIYIYPKKHRVISTLNILKNM